MARILVVDPDPQVLQTVKTVLSWQRHEVTVSNRPDHALQLAGEAAFDLILVSHAMPEYTGFDFQRALQLLRPEAMPPVLLLVSADSPALAASCQKHGIRHWMAKPLQPERLVVEVGRALNSG